MKIALIGTGVYGTAIAMALNKKNKNITMWTESEERYSKYIKDGNVIKDVIPGMEIPKNIKLTISYEKAVKDADIVFITSTAAFVGSICKNINPYITKKTVVCIASKGIENTSCAFLSDIAYDNLKTKHIAIISGPSFAIDMASNNPVGLSLASHSRKATKLIKEALENDTLKLRPTSDLIGVQICGSVKNIIAVAAGMLDGIDMSCLKGALMSRGTYEIAKLTQAMGGKVMTAYGLSHLGDFEATLFSPYSHNRMWGEQFVKGETFGKSAEGVGNIKGILYLAKKHNISMPITEALYNIIFEHKELKSEFEKLFLRSIKNEFEEL